MLLLSSGTLPSDDSGRAKDFFEDDLFSFFPNSSSKTLSAASLLPADGGLCAMEGLTLRRETLSRLLVLKLN